MKFSLYKGTVLGGLPVTVSGIVFWGMVLVGLFAIIIISKDQEHSLEQTLQLNSLVVASVIEDYLEHSQQGRGIEDHTEVITGLVNSELPSRGFEAVQISDSSGQILIGTPSDNADILERVAYIHQSGSAVGEDKIHLRFFVPNREETITGIRNELFVTIGAVVFVFGFVLQQILQRVLSRPIMQMVQVAQSFREGNIDVRFNESRKDELGYMAKFINGALDSIMEQQQATKRALDALAESQTALQEQHHLLEVRVRERTEELRAANRELEAYSYSIAHDLRQPLRAIDGFSQLLLEDYEDRLDEEGRSYLNRVRDAAQRMGRMIDDILELSRITRSQMDCEEVDLVKESQTILDRLQSQHLDRRVRVHIASALKAYGDPILLKVTLENLLGNAWKYSAENPDAEIEFGCIQDGDRPVYFVKDNGIGFDERYSDKLFKPFERLHNDSRFEGTGIGLATVSRAIHRMGGEIWAQSRPGKGATFFFTLDSCR